MKRIKIKSFVAPIDDEVNKFIKENNIFSVVSYEEHVQSDGADIGVLVYEIHEDAE